MDAENKQKCMQSKWHRHIEREQVYRQKSQMQIMQLKFSRRGTCASVDASLCNLGHHKWLPRNGNILQEFNYYLVFLEHYWTQTDLNCCRNRFFFFFNVHQ